MDYSELNDYELIYQVKESDEIAYRTLFEKYEPLISKIAQDYYRRFKQYGIELEDLCQEGYYGLSLAIRHYDSSSCLFYTFSSVCIKREIERFVRRETRGKRATTAHSISLETPISGSEDMVLGDIFSFEDDTFQTVCLNDLLEKAHQYILSLDFENASICELKLNGYKNAEIATLLSCSRTAVERQVVRMRKTFLKWTL